MRPRASERAFTMLEMAVALAILAVVSLAVFTVLGDAQRLESRAIVLGDLRSRARAAIDRIAREVREARASSIASVAQAPLSSSSISFLRPAPAQPTDTAMVFEPVTIALQPTADASGDAVDDDSDGLTDEQDVVFRGPDGATSLVVAGVPALALGEAANGTDDDGDGLADEPGLYFAWDPSLRTVRVGLTLALRYRTGEILTWRETTTVSVRNH